MTLSEKNKLILDFLDWQHCPHGTEMRRIPSSEGEVYGNIVFYSNPSHLWKAVESLEKKGIKITSDKTNALLRKGSIIVNRHSLDRESALFFGMVDLIREIKCRELKQ